MKVHPVAELKAGFSKVLGDLRRGVRTVLYAKSKSLVAMIVPHDVALGGQRELGLLDGKVTIEFADDFEVTEEEFLGDGSGATRTQGQCTP